MMKNMALLILPLALCFGCNSVESNQIKTEVEEKSEMSIKQDASIEAWEIIEEEIDQKINIDDYDQDSLYQKMLGPKTNKSLKHSVLKEVYLRGLVVEGPEYYHIHLPFDLHGFDCAHLIVTQQE
jgi:hypothetical protein